jgi:hypothetical protein
MVEYLPIIDTLELEDFTEGQIRMLQMLQFTVWHKSYEECGFACLLEGFRKMRNCPILFNEMMEILNYNYDKIDFIDRTVDLGFDCPLDIHCNYTAEQILVAMDYYEGGTVQGGVLYLPHKKADLLFITLNKTLKEYSPTTMYDNYSINELLFHWQSQNKTHPETPTGQRYIHSRERNNHIMLFVREFKNDLAGTAPYTFLGTADFVKSEGRKPMNITWKLHNSIPAKYLKKTNKLVVG